MTSLLQILQTSAQRPSHILRHPKPNHDASLGYAVSIRADRGKAHPDYPAALAHLGYDVRIQDRRSPVEQKDPFAVQILSLSYRSHSHPFSTVRNV